MIVSIADRHWWRALTVVGCLAALVAWLLPVVHAVNDDFGAVMILSGADGFEPAAEVPFLSQTANLLFYNLYQQMPRVAWFGWAVWATSIWGATLMLAALLRAAAGNGRQSPSRETSGRETSGRETSGTPVQRANLWVNRYGVLWVAAPGLSLLMLHCFYRPTFTSAALLLEFGVFASVLQVCAAGRGRLSLWWALGLAAACLWRWKLTVYLAPFGLVCLLFASGRQRKYLAMTAVVVLAVVVGDRFWQPSNDVAGREFYQLRSRFHDRPEGRLGPNSTEALAAAGWTQQDMQLFQDHWVIYDDGVFDSAAISRFLAANHQAPSVSGRFRRIVDTFRNSWRDNYYYLTIAGLAAIAILLWPLPVTGRRGRRARIVGTIVLCLVFTLALMAFRFVPRIGFPIVIYTLLVCLLTRFGPVATDATDSGDSSARVHIRRLLGGVAVAVAGLSLIGGLRLAMLELRDQRVAKVDRAFICDALDEFVESPEFVDRILMIRMNPGGGFRHDARHPLQPMVEPRFRLLPAGWQIGSRRFYAIVDQFHCATSRCLLRSAIDNPSIVFPLFAEPDEDPRMLVEQWEGYYQRHLSSDDRVVRFVADFSKRDADGRQFVVYRCRIATPTDKAEEP